MSLPVIGRESLCLVADDDDDDGRAYPSPVAGNDVDGVISTLTLTSNLVSRTVCSRTPKN